MKDKWAEKWDEVSAKQWHERMILEEMEDSYYAKKRSFEERYNRLDDFRLLLQNGIEQNYEGSLAMLQGIGDNPHFEEARQNLINMTEQAVQYNQDQFVYHRDKLEIEEEAFEQAYRKAHSEQEDKIDALHWELVKIDLAEQEEKKESY